MNSIYGHINYPLKLNNGDFVLIEVLLLHERIHKENFENDYVNWHKNALYSFLSKWNKKCNDFTSISEAKESALNYSQQAFTIYWQNIFSQYLWWNGLDERMPEEYRIDLKAKMEKETHNDHRIIELLLKYKNEALKKCNSNF